MDLSSLAVTNIPPWLIWGSLIVVLTVLCRFLAGKLFAGLVKRAEATRNRWDDCLLQAGQKPTFLFIWAIGLGWAAEAVLKGVESALLPLFESFRELLFVALSCWALVFFIQTVEGQYLNESKKVDQTSVAVFGRLVRVMVIMIGLLVVFQTLGYSLSGVLAFGGVGGLAVGFAAKDLLANFFGGWMIYIDKPFRVGDWIRSPDRDIEGVIEAIGWRQTRIRTFTRRPLYVPNSTFITVSIENPSRMENRRIRQTFGLRYGDSNKVDPILGEIRSYLQKDEDIAKDRIIIVNFINFGPSSLDCQIYCFTKTTGWSDYLLVQEKVLLEVVKIVRRHGADIAFPTRTLDFPADSDQTLLCTSQDTRA